VVVVGLRLTVVATPHALLVSMVTVLRVVQLVLMICPVTWVLYLTFQG